MKFEIVPAHDISFADQAAIFNEAFAGYLAGWSEMDAAAVARFLCAQGADLCHSRFLRANGALVSFGYINRTGNIARLAGMGTVPETRKSGAAAFLLSQLMSEAKARADEAMVLEVFEQNVPALELYRRNGFRELMGLFAWRRARETGNAEQATAVEEISLIAASQARSCSGFPDIPWQISPHAVAKLTAGRAFKIDNVHIVIGDPAVDPIRVHGLFWQEEKNWDAPRNALAAVLRRFPKSGFFAPAIFPEQFGTSIFEPLGFVREPLNQVLMRRDL